jgi:hypothetical protein
MPNGLRPCLVRILKLLPVLTGKCSFKYTNVLSGGKTKKPSAKQALILAEALVVRHALGKTAVR